MASIYIHIPFCHSKCYYCDFYSRPCHHDGTAVYANYIGALAAEWISRRDEINEPVHTIYIGGGTPSIVAPELFRPLLDVLPVKGIEEFTIEANPEDVTPQWAEAIRRLGINRVSMGAQSMIDSELKAVGRRHTAADTMKAYDILRRCGFENISLDLIYGLPGQTMETWLQSLDTLLELQPEHLSAYSLTYEEGTRLNAMRLAGKVIPASDSVTEEMYQLLCAKTASAGYSHYEISNFALPGKHARHNSSYWNFTPYLGLGVAAHSFDGIGTRRVNPPDIAAYISVMQAGEIFFTAEEETATDLYNDYIITHLRTLHGIDPSALEMRFGADMLRRFNNDIAPHAAAGRIERNQGRWRITPTAWLVSDAILRDIIII